MARRIRPSTKTNTAARAAVRCGRTTGRGLRPGLSGPPCFGATGSIPHRCMDTLFGAAKTRPTLKSSTAWCWPHWESTVSSAQGSSGVFVPERDLPGAGNVERCGDGLKHWIQLRTTNPNRIHLRHGPAPHPSNQGRVHGWTRKCRVAVPSVCSQRARVRQSLAALVVGGCYGTGLAGELRARCRRRRREMRTLRSIAVTAVPPTR
jgi:hypothetical protein